MNGTKLSSLQKNLSQWQKEQKKKGYHNPEMFLKPTFVSPWDIGRKETQKIKNTIPSTSHLNFGFSARHRNNREMNQAIHNQKILQKAKLFSP